MNKQNQQMPRTQSINRQMPWEQISSPINQSINRLIPWELESQVKSINQSINQSTDTVETNTNLISQRILDKIQDNLISLTRLQRLRAI